MGFGGEVDHRPLMGDAMGFHSHGAADLVRDQGPIRWQVESLRTLEHFLDLDRGFCVDVRPVRRKIRLYFRDRAKQCKRALFQRNERDGTWGEVFKETISARNR